MTFLKSEMSGWEELIGVVVSLDLSYSLKEYVQALAKVPQQKLDDLQTRIVIIGCGEWQPIQTYAGVYSPFPYVLTKTEAHATERTGFKGAIYADPTRSVYHALGMDIERLALTPADEKKRGYVRSNIVSLTLSSIWVPLHSFSFSCHCTHRAWQNGPVTNPGLIGKQGNISQLGGEFILGPGKLPIYYQFLDSNVFSGCRCSFASRMQHTEDRTSSLHVSDLDW